MPLERRRHNISVEALQRIVDQQQRVIARLSTNEAFGCLTRQALDLILENLSLTGLAAVFWDVDRLKQANDRWGKAESSRRIKLAIHTRATDCVAGQVFSGDEFIAFPPLHDAVAMAHRVRLGFEAVEMSATFYVALPRPNETGAQILERADQMCARAKAQDLRGCVHLDNGC